MLVVGAMLLRSAVSGQRCWMHGPDSASPHRGKRYGPFVLQQLAACLVIADPLRHVLADVGLWAGCSNNLTYARINSTDPFPTGCYSSSYQYRCTVPCCVPTWRSAGNGSAAAAEYAWLPPQSQLPELATLRPDGTVYLPSGYAASQQPWEVFRPGALLWGSGLAHAGRGGMSEADCEHGVNNATGYCFLVDEATPMPYADRLKLLPLKDAAKPFDAATSAPPAPHPRTPSRPPHTPSRPLAHPGRTRPSPQPSPATGQTRTSATATSALPARRWLTSRRSASSSPSSSATSASRCSPSPSHGTRRTSPHAPAPPAPPHAPPPPHTHSHHTPPSRRSAGERGPVLLPSCHPLSPPVTPCRLRPAAASLHLAAPACWWLVCRCLPPPPPRSSPQERQYRAEAARHARQVAGTAQPCIGGQRATRLDGVEQMWRGWWGGGRRERAGLARCGAHAAAAVRQMKPRRQTLLWAPARWSKVLGRKQSRRKSPRP